MNLNRRPLDKHEQKARERKAEALAGALRAVGVPSHKARLITDDEWKIVARAAGCNPPNTEDNRTKLMVYGLIEAEEFRQTRMSVREWKARVEAQHA
jgi:hypothetical protein